ncbi:MAG: hypothetical protein V1904_09965 [Bacteroidota bacterium]
MLRKIDFITPILLIIIAICGCGQRNSSNVPLTGQDSTNTADDGFPVVYKEFTEAVKHESFPELKNVLDPAVGIFIIESPGALPVVYNLPDVEAFVSQNGKTLFDFFNDKISREPVSSDMPVVDCVFSNGTPYNKTGCFMKSISSSDNELNFISSAGGNADDKQKAEDARKKLSMKVINTYNHVYYFTKSGDKWYLTFIDLRKPCEA